MHRQGAAGAFGLAGVGGRLVLCPPSTGPSARSARSSMSSESVPRMALFWAGGEDAARRVPGRQFERLQHHVLVIRGERAMLEDQLGMAQHLLGIAREDALVEVLHGCQRGPVAEQHVEELEMVGMAPEHHEAGGERRREQQAHRPPQPCPNRPRPARRWARGRSTGRRRSARSPARPGVRGSGTGSPWRWSCSSPARSPPPGASAAGPRGRRRDRARSASAPRRSRTGPGSARRSGRGRRRSPRRRRC